MLTARPLSCEQTAITQLRLLMQALHAAACCAGSLLQTCFPLAGILTVQQHTDNMNYASWPYRHCRLNLPASSSTRPHFLSRLHRRHVKVARVHGCISLSFGLPILHYPSQSADGCATAIATALLPVFSTMLSFLLLSPPCLVIGPRT